MMLNHQPADPQVAAFMLRMIAQALQVQPVSCPLPERSTQLRAARAATVNTQSAALMQRTDDVLIMGISALAVVVLRLASEEQRTFTLATLPIHHDFWVSTLLLLLIEALQQHAGHGLGGILVILSAILLQQFEGNVISLDAAQMHSAVSRGEPLLPHVLHGYACRPAATLANDPPAHYFGFA